MFDMNSRITMQLIRCLCLFVIKTNRFIICVQLCITLNYQYSYFFVIAVPGEDYSQCGKAGDIGQKLRGRVVGGYEANEAAWPWQAAIYWQRADGSVSDNIDIVDTTIIH